MRKQCVFAASILAYSVALPANAQVNDDCTLQFIGHVRSQFQSQIAAAEPIKIFVLISKRVTPPGGTLQMFVTCDAPHVGKGNFTTDPTTGIEDTWEPKFVLVDDPNPIPPRIALSLNEFYPTTRPFLDDDRSFVQEEGYKLYQEDLNTPNCYYYYSGGEKKKYCW